MPRFLIDYKTADGYRLGSWVSNQRKTKDSMSPERKARLEALPGWSWDALSDKWEEGFRYLKEFADREGHARVPALLQNGRWISTWSVGKYPANNKRQPVTGAQSTAGSITRLELGCSCQTMWEEGFRYLKEFADREGHTKVPTELQNGRWISSRYMGK